MPGPGPRLPHAQAPDPSMPIPFLAHLVFHLLVREGLGSGEAGCLHFGRHQLLQLRLHDQQYFLIAPGSPIH